MFIYNQGITFIRNKMPAITFYVNEADKAKIRKLAERNGITMTKLCRNIIAEWVRVRIGNEEED